MAFVYLIFAAALAFIPMNIASKKGYSAGGFYAFGFFLFLPAVIVAACLEDKSYVTATEDRRTAELRELRQKVAKLTIGFTESDAAANKQKERIDPVCPNCGKGNAGAKFCRSCGTQLNVTELAEASCFACPRCRHTVSEADVFCGECGGQIEAEAPKAVSVSSDNGNIVCPVCNAAQLDSRVSCWKCGVEFAIE